MADWHFQRAESWAELVEAHGRFVSDYNVQRHFAHQGREDGRRSPEEVLGWVTGVRYLPEDLERAFFSTRHSRVLDDLGYARFRHWRVYGEEGLARKEAELWLQAETLTVEYAGEPLARYEVSRQPGTDLLRSVARAQLFESSFVPPQLRLFPLEEFGWLKALRVGEYATRIRRRPSALQQVLAPVLMEFVLYFAPDLPLAHGWYWENMAGQSAFACAALAVALSRRSSWGSIGLSRAGLVPSLTLGVLYCAVFFLLSLVAVRLGLLDSLGLGAQIERPSRFLGAPLAFLLYLPFWGVFESTWMAYLIFTVNRWLVGEGDLRWRALLLAALWFGTVHVTTQVLWAGTPLPQAMLSVLVGLALLIPGTIPKLTGNAWGLVLWFVVTNF